MEPTDLLLCSQKPTIWALSQVNPVHCHLFYFLKIHFNITLASTPRCSKCGLFPSGSPNKTMYAPLLSPICATSPAYLILFDIMTNNNWWVLQIMKLPILQFRLVL